MDKTEFKAFGALYGNGPAPTASEVSERRIELARAVALGESEHRHQARLHTWLKRQHILHFAPANEGKRTEKEQRALSVVGFTCGIPDIWILEARKPWHVLILELKTERGVISAAQDYWLRELNARQYKAVVSYSFEQSKQIVIDYLALPT
jgi:hypothetical protein